MSRYFTRARKALWVSDDFDEPAKPRAIGFGRRDEW